MNFNWKKNINLEISSRRWKASLDRVNTISRWSVEMLKGDKTSSRWLVTGINGRYWEDSCFKWIALEDVFDERFSIILNNCKIDIGLQRNVFLLHPTPQKVSFVYNSVLLSSMTWEWSFKFVTLNNWHGAMKYLW